jgi:FkbM family methyltransferase
MRKPATSASLRSEVRGPSLRRVFERGSRCARVLWRRHVLRERYIEQDVHDYRMLLDAGDPGLSRELLCAGAREAEQKFVLERELRAGMNVFDLGANLGYYTVMLSRLVGSTGRVYAVEPVASNFELLLQNIRLNALLNVEPEQVAIADRDGSKRLLLTERSNWHSFISPDVDPGIAWLRKYRRRIVGGAWTPARTLSTYLAGKPRMDLVRMDLEGYEGEILEGVRALSEEETPRRILFETHPEFYGNGEQMRDVLDRLRRERSLGVKYLISDFQHGSMRYTDVEPARRIFERRGYGAKFVVREFRNRAVYADIRQDDAVDLICHGECVNSALLAAV